MKKAPCDEFIAEHYDKKSDLIIYTLSAIDSQKDRARIQAKANKNWDRQMSGTLIILAFLTTVTAAVARTYRDDKKIPQLRNILGLLPIVMAASVTLMAGFSTYYNFGDLRLQHARIANDLAALQSEIHFELIRRVSETNEDGLANKDVQDWQIRLDGIMALYQLQSKKPDE